MRDIIGIWGLTNLDWVEFKVREMFREVIKELAWLPPVTESKKIPTTAKVLSE
jgi:hypothetical protein